MTAVAEQFAPGRVRLIMAALLLATAMASLDSSFMPLAFADMIEDLDSSTSEIVWVALGYLVAATGPMLLAARWADAFGHARLFQAGATLYSLALVACTWAPDVEVLIGLRLLQGLGMALFLPTTFVIAARIYGPERRGRALGLLQAANAAGFILGPVFAGFLLDAYDWRAIFGSRIPLAGLMIALALIALGFSRPLAVPTASRRFDLPGAACLTGALFGVLYGCTRLPVEDNHLDPVAWAVFGSGFALFALFLRRERRCPEPLVDLSLFSGNPEFARAALAFAAMFASFPITLFVLPIVLINGLEMRAWDVGFLMALSALCTTVVSPFAGRAADRMAPEWLASAGTLGRAAGYLLLLLVTPATGVVGLLLPLVVIGLSTGLFFSPNNALLLAHAPPERAGMVSGLFGTLRQTGYALGFAVIASLFAAIQTKYERDWSFTALLRVPAHTAEELTAIFDGGSIWSPEMLIFILRVSAVVCTAVLLITLVNSWPRLRMSWRRQAAGAAVAGGAALAGSYALALLVPGGFALNEQSVRRLAEDESISRVAAFGMASRAAPAELRPTSGGGADLFAAHCAGCHGPEGGGVPGLGVSFGDSRFVRTASREELVRLLRRGRLPDDPETVTGRAMPAFDWLPAEQLNVLAERVRELR